MNDLVERARDDTKFETWEDLTGLIAELADEIERLRTVLLSSFREGEEWKTRNEKAGEESVRLRAEKSQLHGALQLANRNYAEARSEALEQAAKVADEYSSFYGPRPAQHIAAAIRVLKEKPDPLEEIERLNELDEVYGAGGEGR